MAGTSVRMFVLGDDPQSLKTVELGNWTGRAIFGPRIQLGEALKTRDELRQPSVYFLLAQSPDNPALTEVYIGEAEDFASRVKAHEKDKDWWEVFVVFGSKDTNLTKAHIRFLERWFYDRAAGNIFRIHPEARALKAKAGVAVTKPYRLEDIKRIISAYDKTGEAFNMPRTVRVTYTLSVKPAMGDRKVAGSRMMFRICITPYIPRDH